MLKWLDDYFEEALMTVLLVLITVTISYSIFMRYALNNALSWGEEITRFFFIWSAFLSIGLCIKRQSSIRIDMLLSALSPKQRDYLQILVNGFMVLVFVYWLKAALKVTHGLIFVNPQTSAALNVPMWTIYGSSVVGFGLGIIRSAQQIYYLCKGLRA